MAWYYIEPRNAHTNEVIADAVNSTHFPASMALKRGKDGELHETWECDFPHIKELASKKKELNIDFNVLTRRPGLDFVYRFGLFDFIENKKKSRITKVLKKVRTIRTAMAS